MKLSDIGILIDKKNYAESSVILHFYTKDFGRQHFIFKGAKQKKKPLFPLGIYEITYAKRPESELGIIQELTRVSGINDIYENPQKSLLAFFISEILKSSLKQSEQDGSMFHFLQAEIIALEVGKEIFAFPLKFISMFIIKSGYMPQIDTNKGNFFNLQTGSVVSDESNATVHISTAQIKQLTSLFNGDEIVDLKDKPTVRKNLELLIDYCIVHIPGFNVKTTREIIQDILYT